MGWDSSARSGGRGNDRLQRSQEPPGGPPRPLGATETRLLEAGVEGVRELVQGDRVESDEGFDFGARQLAAPFGEASDDPLGSFVERPAEVLVRDEPPHDPFHVGLGHFRSPSGKALTRAVPAVPEAAVSVRARAVAVPG